MSLGTHLAESLSISVAHQKELVQLTDLISHSYARTPDFSVHNHRNLSASIGTKGAVLGARLDGRIVSTMSAALIYSPADMDFEDEGCLEPQMVPALHLSRAATIEEIRISGLNSIMRFFCIKAAIQLQLRTVVGTVFADAPRTRLMKELGYRFVPLEGHGDRVMTYQSQCLFAALDLEQSGESAMRLLTTRYPALRFPSDLWTGPELSDALRSESNADHPN